MSCPYPAGFRVHATALIRGSAKSIKPDKTLAFARFPSADGCSRRISMATKSCSCRSRRLVLFLRLQLTELSANVFLRFGAVGYDCDHATMASFRSRCSSGRPIGRRGRLRPSVRIRYPSTSEQPSTSAPFPWMRKIARVMFRRIPTDTQPH